MTVELPALLLHSTIYIAFSLCMCVVTHGHKQTNGSLSLKTNECVDGGD